MTSIQIIATFIWVGY